MNKYEDEKKVLKELGFSGKKLKLLTGLISMDNYETHKKAKNKILKEGEAMVPLMQQLAGSRSDLIRREAAKILKLIPRRSSIPSTRTTWHCTDTCRRYT